ncbi:hypothetical protein EMIHUDRAFT_209953 [Emiliania huxleyi CCMP1516]|uniref:Uncharacterized protein n=2 Tax=Emiliania huxleyi TaxID=2903 RepID=A0A0D3J1D9_EMIH1|nr:hypothetical protein EMIHUDRAFT_209953 [Emiliania huxleyi CCMP1516]EOD17324.1 hypothetical protein EMIHUDRAFT_209953 [Emiliania huxleyi CCMP1516]|eukprot:XP_005769753.1 hypothetical protein EMIHUDRAFT_209953 [Emiliania huxleyi CCMP1516]
MTTAPPPQPQVSHSITSDGTPSVARSAASLWQPHSERGVEPNRSGRSAALPGFQGEARVGAPAVEPPNNSTWRSSVPAGTTKHMMSAAVARRARAAGAL